MQYFLTTVFLPATPPSSNPFPPSLRSTPHSSPFRKEQACKRPQANTTKQNNIRQGQSAHTDAGQGTSITRRQNHKRGKQIQDTPSPAVRSPTETSSNSHSTCRPWACCVKSLWARLSPAELNQWAMFSWCPIPSDSYDLSTLHWDFQSSEGRDPVETSSVDSLWMFGVGLCVHSHLIADFKWSILEI